MRIPDHLTCLLQNLYAGQEATVRSEHGTTDWFHIGGGLCQGCMLSSAYLTYIQSTSCEMPGWMKHNLESKLTGKISITSNTKIIHPYSRKQRRTKQPLDENGRGDEKAGLKLNIQKTKIMASGPITSRQIDAETMETVRDLIFLGSKITADGDCNHEITKTLAPWKESFDQPRQRIKSWDITLPTKVRLVKAMFFFQ